MLLIIAYVWALAPVTFTSFDVKTIVLGGLPLAFAAMAQSVIIISGGIDLSLGVMVAVINVTAASLMEDKGFGTAILIAFGLMAFGVLLGTINGGLIVLTGVPDIVVTLAMSFVWGGVALLIMRTPGGGSPVDFQELGTGSFLSEWIPAGAIIIGLVLLLVWMPIRWRRPGFAIYAIGSNRDRAYLSGVNVNRTRVLAYSVGGFFAAMAGLAMTATTGIGTPYSGNFITLNSVAAAVLGGVSLAGGKGGLVGPVAAAFCLTLVPAIMVFQGIDPNYSQVIQGALIVVVVMIAGLLLLRERAMSTVSTTPDEPLEPRANRASAAAQWVIDRPLVMLAVILVLLLITCEIVSPGYLSDDRMGDDPAVLGAARVPGRRADARDADRADRPVGRRDRHGGGVHHGRPGVARHGDGAGDRGARRPGRRPGQRHRRRRVPREPADHDAGHGEHRRRLPDGVGAVVRHRRAAGARASCASSPSAT